MFRQLFRLFRNATYVIYLGPSSSVIALRGWSSKSPFSPAVRERLWLLFPVESKFNAVLLIPAVRLKEEFPLLLAVLGLSDAPSSED